MCGLFWLSPVVWDVAPAATAALAAVATALPAVAWAAAAASVGVIRAFSGVSNRFAKSLSNFCCACIQRLLVIVPVAQPIGGVVERLREHVDVVAVLVCSGASSR